MTRPSMTCDRVESLLADWLDRRLDDATALAVHTHLSGCARCGVLLASLDAQDSAAAQLPVLAPSRDLWPAIADRIQPVTVSLAQRRGSAVVPRRFGWVAQLAAASALVVVTAGVTWKAATSVAGAGHRVATEVGLQGLSRVGADTRAVSDHESAEFTYDREIAKLRRIVSERRRDIDPATAAILDKNLKVIDRALAASRAALDKDPASAILADQLSTVLDRKLQLLRTVALLPSRS